MIQRTLFVAVVAMLIASTVASAHSHHHHHHHNGDGDDVDFHWEWHMGNTTLNEAFSHCLCWNSTSSDWCYRSESNGNFSKGGNGAFWSRKSCQQLVTRLYWWIVPAVLFASFFIVFPVLFFVARMLCNCCGGRNPSYGCCCPVNNKLIHQAQLEGVKNFKRPYSRCTTFWAKLLACLALAAYISVSVHGFIGNDRSSNSIKSLTQALSVTVADMETGVNSTLSTLTTLTQKNLTHVNLATLANDKQEYAHAVREINRVLTDMDKAEDHDEFGGRFGWTIRLIAVPLFFITLVTILAFCNIRGCVISLFMGLLSFMAFAMCVVWIISLSLTETLHIACDNYNTSFAPFVVDMIHNQKGCGSTSALDGINRTETLYLSALCGPAGLANACATGLLSCPVNACQKGTYTTALQEQFVNVSAIVQTLAAARSSEGMNLTTCAATATCTANSVAQAVTTVAGNYASAVNVLDNEFSSLYNCNGLRSDLQNVIYQPLCTQLVPNFHHLSVLLVGLSMVMFFTMFIWIYGAKRFTKGSRKDDLEKYQMLISQPHDGVVVNASPAPHQVQAYPIEVAAYPAKEEPLLPAASNFAANYGAASIKHTESV